jgi:hypothetical protein
MQPGHDPKLRLDLKVILFLWKKYIKKMPSGVNYEPFKIER